MSNDITPFEQITETIDAGEHEPDRHVMAQINEAITKSTRATMNSGKKSTITIKIVLTPGAQRQVSAGVSIDTKLPNPPMGAVRLFADGMGNLHASDPQQGALFSVPTRSQKAEEN